MNSVAEMVSDPQLRHRQMVVAINDPVHRPQPTVGIPVKLSDTPRPIRRLAAACGEHTEAVLLEIGYRAVEVAALRQRRVV